MKRTMRPQQKPFVVEIKKRRAPRAAGAEHKPDLDARTGKVDTDKLCRLAFGRLQRS